MTLDFPASTIHIGDCREETMTDAEAKKLHREVYKSVWPGHGPPHERIYYNPGALKGIYCRGYVDARMGKPQDSGVKRGQGNGGDWGYQMDRAYMSGYADGTVAA